MKLLVTLPEAAEMTSMGQSTIQRRVKLGTFPKPVYNGSSMRFKMADIEQFVEKLPNQRPSREVHP